MKPSALTEYNGAYNWRYVFSQQTVDEQWKEITVEVAVKHLCSAKKQYKFVVCTNGNLLDV